MTMIGENAIDNKIHFDQSLSLVTVGGACVRSGTYVWLNCVEADDGYRLESVKAHVVRELPLGVDIIFGMDVISRSGLVVGDAGRSVKLGSVSAVNVLMTLLKRQMLKLQTLTLTPTLKMGSGS